ncbi:exodeoxyribonuclease I [Candidatus Saccharibacteria bacterium]|nr:exodeoxyribonuclease I [Candidatus Saccharibacteria bacterium]
MNKTFFFYDLETSGLRQREDRIMQFAGQRTDMELNPIGEPVNILVKMTDDALPSPGAIMVTKITPQQTLADGIMESEFCRIAMDEIFVPNTIALGYNTVRFDDEFMRATLWRNFYDPYEWEWKDGRSRWDLLDVVRMTRALRPEGINWPVTDEGKATNRLELLTKENGLAHEHAHDALSDVYATIAVAKLIREKQRDIFDYLLRMRDKREVMKLVNLENPQPFVYSSGRYSSEYEKTTVAFPLAPGKNGNVLVFDLRHSISPDFPIVKELCFNKCPAVAPMAVLDKADGWRKIGLEKDTVMQNLTELLKHPEFAEQMRTMHEKRPEFPPAVEPEQALYDGFLSDTDRIKVSAVRNADAARLADFHPDFHDPRLPELLLHYKGRNFPESLSEQEAEKWESYRKERLLRQVPKFMEELAKFGSKDEFIAEELKLYFENVFASDY